ncbi:MAG TPA: lysylphosphatidylglycerol synthase transmembrane domain-containing protein [Nitrososphaera sp.]|nr:lysylphosphatidylglycerol synthase transmembrane domain-containing protein [Nitrososphaera sp.]
MNWRLVAIPASVVPFLILFLTTKVSPQDVFAVGLFPFIGSAAAGLTKILLQAYRFKYFIKSFIGYDVSSTGKTISARLAGEFVTQTTPSYVGGEFVRIAWLSKNGVAPGKAAWVTTMEIIADVFVASMLAFIAGALAISRGGTVVGIAVILITIPTFGVWLALLLFSAKRNLRLPSFAQRLIERFMAKEKAERFVTSANSAIADLCKMSRENFNSPRALRTFAIGMAITFVAFVFQGISFMVLANAVQSRIGLFDSLMATSASTALANLPITIGGSGLAELGIWAYISNLSGVPTLETLASDSQLNVIIAWRIATYHVPLAIMWIALMKLAVGKVSAADMTAGSQSGSHSAPDKKDPSSDQK